LAVKRKFERHIENNILVLNCGGGVERTLFLWRIALLTSEYFKKNQYFENNFGKSKLTE
jgi:hypothetical protein